MKNLHNALLLKQLYGLKQLGYKYSNITPSTIEESPLELPSTLSGLKKQATSCHLCEVSKTRSVVLFGEGNPNAKLLFVGDFPTIAEESANRLFVGRGGEMLTNMIEKVLLIPRKDVYITNLLKCRPHNSSSLSPTHIHTCLPYLKKEIETINPAFVISLGITPYHYLTGESSQLSEVRGVARKQDNYRIIPTFHPSYLLRNPSAKKEAFDDMKLIKSLI